MSQEFGREKRDEVGRRLGERWLRAGAVLCCPSPPTPLPRGGERRFGFELFGAGQGFFFLFFLCVFVILVAIVLL